MEKFLRKGFRQQPCGMCCAAAGAGGGGCLGVVPGVACECLAVVPSWLWGWGCLVSLGFLPPLPASWRPSRHPGSAGTKAPR